MRDVPHWSIRTAVFIQNTTPSFFYSLFLQSFSLGHVSSVHLLLSASLSIPSLSGLNQQPWQRLPSEVVLRDERWHGCGAWGRSHPLWHTHTHTPSLSLSLSHTHVRPALSFAAEMVPAWANLHNTLLTPLLYSSITPRQLLQVQAFVWACLCLCKARHKRLISQLFFFLLFFLLPLLPSPPSFPLPLFLVLFILSCSSLSFVSQIQQNDGQPDNENNNASIFFSLSFNSGPVVFLDSLHTIIPLFLSSPPSLTAYLAHPLPRLHLRHLFAALFLFFSFIFVIPPYCTRADQEQIPCQSFLLSSTCPTRGAPSPSPFTFSSNLKTWILRVAGGEFEVL